MQIINFYSKKIEKSLSTHMNVCSEVGNLYKSFLCFLIVVFFYIGFLLIFFFFFFWSNSMLLCVCVCVENLMPFLSMIMCST